MSRVKRDALVVVWDVGTASTQKCKNQEMTFLEASRRCLQKMIANKLLIQQKDLLGVVAFGTEDTNHTLDLDGFDHISVLFELQQANIDILKTVGEFQSSQYEGDWLGGMCIGLLAIKECTVNLQNKTVVLISPLTPTVDAKELKKITKGLKKLDAKLIVIGPEVDMDELHQQETITDTENLLPLNSALKILCTEAQGQVWNFKDAMQKLTVGYTSRAVSPRPWKIELQIGSRLKIAMAGFNEICPEPRPKFTSLTEKDMSKTVAREKAFFEKGNKRKLVEQENVIQGHKFGTSLVPFSEEDAQALKFKTGEMCVKLIAFVRKEAISPAMFISVKGCQSFIAQPSPVDQVYFSALVSAMMEKEMVALVRKVTRPNSRLIFGALLPQLREQGRALVLVELPFADDMRRYRFRKPKVRITQEQLDLMDELIDNTNLMTANPDGSEAFHDYDTPDPSLIYLNEMIIMRAAQPDCALLPPSEDVLGILSPPPSVKLALEKLSPSLEGAFDLEKERKNAARPGTSKKVPKDPSVLDENGGSEEAMVPAGAENLPLSQPLVADDVSVAAVTNQRVVEVGSVTPAEDVQELLRQGRPLADVCQQCCGVVVQLATLASSELEVAKPLAAVRALRTACVRKDPALYNSTIKEIRSILEDRERLMLWEAIRAGELGLVTRLENPLGGVSEQEASEFLNPSDSGNHSMSMDMDDIL